MKGKISLIELTIISTILIVGTVFIQLPARLALLAEQSGWLGIPLAMIPGILLALAIAWLHRRFPDQSPVRYMREILGEPLGSLFAIYITALLLAAAAFLVRDFSVAIIIGAQPLMPLSLVVVIFLLLLLFMTFWGLEVIARTAVAFLPYIVISPILVTIGNLRFSQPGRLLPLLGAGLKPIAAATFTSSVYFSELLIMSAVLPRVRDARRASLALSAAVLLAVPPLATVAASAVAVFGPTGTARAVVPGLELARMVSFGESLQRFEAVFVVFWMMAAMIKVGVFVWVASEMLAETIRIENYRLLLPSIGALVFVLAMLPQHFWDQTLAFEVLARLIAISFYTTPAVLMAVALIRRKGGRTSNGQQ